MYRSQTVSIDDQLLVQFNPEKTAKGKWKICDGTTDFRRRSSITF